MQTDLFESVKPRSVASSVKRGKKAVAVSGAAKPIQHEFGFVADCVRAWVRPLVMTFKPWNVGGWDAARNARVTLNEWLMWHAPLNGKGAQ